MEPFTVSLGDSVVIASSKPRLLMRQLRPPEPVSVTLRNSQPVMFFYRELRYAVEHADGPWLVGSDWWKQTLWGLQQ